MIIKYGFEQLNLHRISSGAFSFNERSIKMHLKLGFKEEGRHREVVFKNGAYHDEVMFGLLRDEWQKRSSNAWFEGENIIPVYHFEFVIFIGIWLLEFGIFQRIA